MNGARETGTTDAPSWERLDRYRIPLGLVVLVVILRPLVAQPFLLGFGQIAATMLIWMLFVAAFNLLFGFTGLLSFGHAMFLGMGMYAAAIGVAVFGLPWVFAALVGIILTAIFAYVLGRFIVEKGEIYFAMLTLAVAQAIYYIVKQDPGGLTGGSNGLTQGTLPGWIQTIRGSKRVVFGPVAFDWYWLVALVFLVCMLALWQLLRSPFGHSLVAIRENEALARAMGVDTRRYKVASFTASGTFAAIAGALLEVNNHGAALAVFAVQTSGDAVLMAVLGGINYYFGPIAGVFVWMFAESYLTDFTTLTTPLGSIDLAGVLSYYSFFLGLLFVVVVLVSPQDGIWGAIRTMATRLMRRLRDVRR